MEVEPLLVQRHLRDGGTLEQLQERYAIKAKRHSKYNSLVLLKYDQIDSPFAEEIVRECRGIILDESDNWRIVSRAFSKFFNYGEGHAAAIDWNTARVQEKLDGSLAVLYWHDAKWHVATSGTPDASGDVNDFGISFAELFWRNYKWELPPDNCGVCFYFELTGPLNRIVVHHAEEKLTLLGARLIHTQQELPLPLAEGYIPGVPVVREFTLKSFEDIAASFTNMSPLTQEGYVVVDGNWNRVKVKHPGYVALHHVKGTLSRKALVEIVRSGETSEVLTAFPEFKPIMDDVTSRYGALVTEIESSYEPIRNIAEQKAFALEAVKTKCPAALFSVRAKSHDSVRSFLKDLRIDSMMQLLGYKDEPQQEQAAE